MTDEQKAVMDEAIEAVRRAMGEKPQPITFAMALALVGSRVGILRESGESDDAYRQRIIANSGVSRIDADSYDIKVKLNGYAKMIVTDLSFCVQSEEQPA